MQPRDIRRTGRAWAKWVLGYGSQRALIRLGAARGDTVGRLMLDPALHDDPTPAYAELRAQGPIGGSPQMAASVDHAACNEILRSDDFGTPGWEGPLPRRLARLMERVSDPQTLSPIDPPSMLSVDPPQHTRYRQQVARAFTARKVGRMADRVEAVASRLLDELADRPSFDLVDRYASLLPVAVISDLLGVPEDERQRVLELGNHAAVTLDPALTWRRFRAADVAMRELHERFAAHVQRLRADPGDDLLSQIITAESDDPLTDVELHQVGLLVLGAGFETTVNLIGNAVVQLDRHPDQRALVLDDPDLWPNVVEEVLRYDAPVQMSLRTARRDTTVQGVPIKGGSPVLAILRGANRDPKVFDDPDRFEITRENAGDHLSFSAGVHYCIGASLARLEADIALRMLYDRFPDLRITGTPERRETRVLRGYEHVRVRTERAVVPLTN